MRKIILLLFMAGILVCHTSCNKSIKTMLEPGVSKELALYRSKQISQVAYALHFHIPEHKDEAVTGKVAITFHQARAMYAVILDFQGGADRIFTVASNGQTADYQYINEHIIIPSDFVNPGLNTVEVTFSSTDQALNRSDDFMYTLFVPDRASTAFPCFDQPDLKATFELTLDIPATWTALSNGALQQRSVSDGRALMQFAPDKPVSTYLFAFAAGVFNTVQWQQGDRAMTLFHRETDQEKLTHNLGSIFRQHADALSWLEDYTGIDYPFGKFDMVLIPGFQYSGMEHPGAIYYRDNRLLLDMQAPISQQLAKASLIAHETAHMWFGDLVTMAWFDDVWLKEVFAGFMADKIVHPQFPDIDHDLQFLLTHVPRARAVDRSEGTHPIKQDLANLKQAGTLYGAIIYNKAPVVFRELERLLGAEAFLTAVRKYLETYAYANADWDDLAAIFDQHTPDDMEAWSSQWIYGTGMPALYLEGASEETRRAADFLEMHEEFLEGRIASPEYCNTLIKQFIQEENPQILRFLITNMRAVWWRFLSVDQREHLASSLETALWDALHKMPATEKPLIFEALAALVTSHEGVDKVKALYDGVLQVSDFVLTDDQRFDIVAACMLRQHPDAENMFGELLAATTNADKRRRISFVQPALASDSLVREAFFLSLKDPVNRRPEPWVLEALQYLHHPLHNQSGREYVIESLEMLPEIQRTGDIFFPLGWLEANLSGYGDAEMAATVRNFLRNHPALDDKLRKKVLQAADLLFRAGSFSERTSGAPSY